MPRRRSRRNRRNRQQPQTPPANQRAPRIIFSPKLKYANSRRNANGVLILSTRKRPLPTAEELEDRKRKNCNKKQTSLEVSIVTPNRVVVREWLQQK